MAKKKKASAQAGGMSAEDAFALMFTSLNLILLSFFILLSTIAVVDESRKLKALGSLRGSFGILEGGQNPGDEGKQLERTNPLHSVGKDTGGAFERDAETLMQRLQGDPGHPDPTLVRSADGLQLRLANRVVFRAGSVTLDPRIYPTLDAIADLLVRHRVSVVVRGYADPRPPRGYPSNLELSVSRAVRVARYLVEGAQMKSKDVRAEGRGALPAEGLAGEARYVDLVIPAAALRAPLEIEHGA